MTVSIGPPAQTLVDVREAFDVARRLRAHKFSQGPGRVISADDVGPSTAVYEIPNSRAADDIRSILLSGSPGAAETGVRSLFGRLPPDADAASARRVATAVLVRVYLTLSEMGADFASVFGRSSSTWEELATIDTRAELSRWIESVVHNVAAYIEGRKKGTIGAIANQARAFIDSHFTEGISVQDVADEVGYSANYLNSLFRERTGSTILEYITERRIERAKHLLISDAGARVYEICEAVGYRHLAHFRNTFKRYVGMGPRQYRDTAAGMRPPVDSGGDG